MPDDGFFCITIENFETVTLEANKISVDSTVELNVDQTVHSVFGAHSPDEPGRGGAVRGSWCVAYIGNVW